ncbi:ankyrin repeat and SOCS box protein 8-like [Saccostrea echinata]|uniref:ankyrin repeat and SOCS box protein 8-like n=1 Tax=Saccostrea echinata TaxID=191078 RepID=UPI002A81C278|nr:ankyrin repeat and SOCS box protein 8-like [Saccostrea echinata]XP_061194200.1 ankyrin repeat and SOCS box protein 8-like [Saccostrea echinata]
MDLLNLIKKKSSPLKKLELAVLENNVKELKEVLESGVDPNTEIQSQGGNCALHMAAHNGYFLCVETLLKYNADPEKTNHFNLTPLYIALRRNQARCAEILLRVNKLMMSIDPVWMQMNNAVNVWNGSNDTMISVLIKATPDLERCRNNLKSNLFFLCKSKNMYGSLRTMAISGYRFSQDEKQYFLNSPVESDKNFHAWLNNFNKQPQRLMHYCRLKIRRSFLGNCNVYYGVEKLPVPKLLKDYIVIKDINEIDL